jgi:hypothetical protein
MDRITAPTLIAAMLAYCNAQQRPCWAIHTPPASTIGGFSCRLMRIDGGSAEVEIANGDVQTVLMEELHLRAA